MTATNGDINSNNQYDEVILQIADHAYDFEVQSPVAWARAKAALLDALGAAFESIYTSTECARLIGSTFPGTAIVSVTLDSPAHYFN